MKFRNLGRGLTAHQTRAAPIMGEGSNWQDVLRDVIAPSDVNQTTSMKLSAVNACVENLSNSISKLPVFMIDGKTKARIHHPVLDILNVRPNEAMTASVYKKLMETNRLLHGNAYAYIVRDPRSLAPRELIPLPPKAVKVHIAASGAVEYLFTHPKTGTQSILNNFDILHYKAYSADGIRGISVLERAAETVGIALLSQKFETKYYTQNARPAGIITFGADLAPEAKEKLRSEWERIYSGVDNAFRTAILDMGVDYKQIGLSNKDSQFVESKGVSVEDIARFFGMPLYKLMAGKQSYSSNEQNSIEYVVNTLHPIVEQLEQEDTYKLLFDHERNRFLELKRNMMSELRGDFNTRASWYRTMSETGAFSVNDILALEDMPNVDGGDTRKASLNYVPLHLFEELSKNRNKGGTNETY